MIQKKKLFDMKTITVQIGNSDDKLTQKGWSYFVKEIASALEEREITVHFFGTSPGNDEWQNACWVFNHEDNAKLTGLKWEIKRIRKKYMQDSVAWTEGETRFI